MTLKIKLSLVLLLAVTYLFGQTILPKEGFFQGTVTFTNGKIKTGYFAAPKHPKDNSVLFKADAKAKTEKIPSATVDSLKMVTDDGSVFYFENMPYAYKPGSKIKDKIWFFVAVKGYATLYLFTDIYLITRKGNAYVVNRGNGNMGSMYFYYLRKKNQKVAYQFAETSESWGVMRLNAILKQAAAEYLSEDADLIDKINKKELTHRNLEEIIHIYNEYMDKRK